MPGAVSPDALRVVELVALQHGVLTDVQGSKEWGIRPMLLAGDLARYPWGVE